MAAPRFRGTLNRLSLLCLVAGIATTLLAESIAPIVSVDFELGSRGHVLVTTSIDETQGVFAVDTAAGSTILDLAFADAAGVRASGDTIEIHGAHGPTNSAPARIDRLALGKLVVPRTDALIYDLSPFASDGGRIDGLIGAPFLRNYDTWFDFNQRRLSLYPPGSVAAIAGASGAAGNDIEFGPGGIVFINVTFAGQRLIAVLDTGSGRSALNIAAAEALGITLPPSDAGRFEEQGQHGPVAAIPNMRLELEAGVLTSTAPVGIVELPVFESLGMTDKPALILGTNFLDDRSFALDYKERKFYLFE